MLIWFAAVSVVLVAIVFRSPGLDYRGVALGAVLPVFEGLLGGPRQLHTLTGAVLVLTAVMLGTRNRRLLRRRLLGVPIGLMTHLVLDGTFTNSALFAWPFLGWSFPDGQIPEWDAWQVSLVLEAIGIGVAVWAWKLFRLDVPAVRERFLRDGRLDLPT